MQAHVGVAPHPAGRSRQRYWLPVPRTCFSQYCVPCAQKIVPQTNFPVGGSQPPTVEMLTPEPSASHGLR